MLDADRIDMSLPGRVPKLGSYHPLTIVEREVVDIFTSLGFRVAEGPEVEDEWHNFQALNIPVDHPARTMKDSLYVSVPDHSELLLRTETSAVQIRTMQAQPPPSSWWRPVGSTGVRPSTRRTVFHQVEGLAVDEGISFADLKGTLEAVARALFGERRRVRLGPAFFPFVEPGCEVGVSCFKCDGRGGVCGTDGSSPSAQAWCTLSCSRTAATTPSGTRGSVRARHRAGGHARYEIPDIRMLIDGDVRFLEQFQGIA